MFLNKNTHEQVAIFNDIPINIFSNYIPKNYVTIEDKKGLSLSQKKFIDIQMLSTEICALILERKEKYYHDLSMKLNDSKTSAKT